MSDALKKIAEQVEAPETANDNAHPLTPVVEPAANDDAGAAIDWPLVEVCANEPETDIGNGRRFLTRHGKSVMMIEGLGWAVYDTRRWVQDFFGANVRPLAHDTVELIRLETKFIKATEEEQQIVSTAKDHFEEYKLLRKKGKARTMEDEHRLMALSEIITAGQEMQAEIGDRKARRARYAKTSASSGKMDNMLQEAAVYRSKPVSVLDADPHAINCENGTLRLFQRKTPGGKAIWDVRLDKHERADNISKLVQAEYAEAAECPQFERFLEVVMPNEAIRSFIQRYLGYCLTALTAEQVFVFFYGQGRNGKSTLVDLVCRLLGDYSTTVPFETLAGDDRRKGSEATPDLVRVPGARLVRASEPETGMKFRESMVKSLTSGEPILIRRMREEFIEVYPTFKLIISGNHRPDIRGGDDGIWRRVLLVPWEVQIPKDQVDRALPNKLWEERAGILNWMIAGALSYLESGLQIPDEVRAATEEYRDQSDAYGAFLRAACEITGVDSDMVSPGDLYAAFKVFCERQGFYAVGVSTFNKAIPDKAPSFGFRKAKTLGLSVYRGLRVRAEFLPSHTHDGDRWSD